MISKIKNGLGEWLQDPADIKQHANDFSKQLLTEEVRSGNEPAVAQFLSYIPKLVTSADNSKLMRPVTMKEAREVIFFN